MNILAERRRSNCLWLFLLVAVAFAPVGSATAQETGGLGVYNEQLRLQLDEQLPTTSEITFDCGGWLTVSFFDFDDAAADKVRTLGQYQLRGWASMNIRDEHKAYIRGVLNFSDWNRGDNPRADRGDDYDEAFERAWYMFDLGQFLRNRTGTRPPVGLRFKIGRDFTTIGTALVLSMPLDMIRFDLSVCDFEVMAMIGKTIKDTHNIDDSVAMFAHQERTIFGTEVAYEGFDHHRPFFYFLTNRDHTNPDFFDPFQSYEYSSSYIGIGSEGAVLLPNLRYQLEFVGEWGRTYSEGVVSGKDRICAMAANAAIEYLFQSRMHPKVKFEYIFGSGDSDRRTSATSTVGGNLAGTEDNAFNAFGFRDTGIAFSPRISNIHIYSLGASFFPLEVMELFKKMELGSKVFFYHKASRQGPISDTTAVNNVRQLGWEWDIFCDWRVTSDLSWTVRYGLFNPSAAFDGTDKSIRHFLYSGFVFSF